MILRSFVLLERTKAPQKQVHKTSKALLIRFLQSKLDSQGQQVDTFSALFLLLLHLLTHSASTHKEPVEISLATLSHTKSFNGHVARSLSRDYFLNPQKCARATEKMASLNKTKKYINIYISPVCFNPFCRHDAVSRLRLKTKSRKERKEAFICLFISL